MVTKLLSRLFPTLSVSHFLVAVVSATIASVTSTIAFKYSNYWLELDAIAVKVSRIETVQLERTADAIDIKIRVDGLTHRIESLERKLGDD